LHLGQNDIVFTPSWRIYRSPQIEKHPLGLQQREPATSDSAGIGGAAGKSRAGTLILYGIGRAWAWLEVGVHFEHQPQSSL